MRRLLVLASIAALALVGCGNKHDYVHVAETEGVYVDVGDLVYQVQMSRFLNPGDREDREYLAGLPEGTPPLTADETWFGVWMRVKNYTDEPLQMAEDIFVVDSDETRFDPVPLSETSVFSYKPIMLGPDQVYPLPDTAASSGPIQGALILFKLTNDSLQNRPLKLEIEQEGFETAEIDLDL
jgi:hypothetical protein